MQRFDVKDIFEWPLTLKVVIASLIGVVFFILGYLWSIPDLKRQLVEKENQEQELKGFLENDINKKLTTENDISQSPKLQKIFQDWDSKLVKPSELPDLLNELLKLGTGNQLKISLLQPEREVKEGNSYTKLPIKIVAIGGYHQIASYLSQIANMRWIVVISNFSIAKGDQHNVNPGEKAVLTTVPNDQLTIELTLEIYYHNETATPKK